MIENEADVWPEGTRRYNIQNMAVLGILVSVLGVFLLDGWIRLGVVICAPLVGIAVGALEDLPHLAAGPDAIEERRRRRVSRIAYGDVVRVTTRWVPYRDSILLIASRTDSIEIRIHERTVDFRHFLGDRLAGTGAQRTASPAAAEALGWASERG